MAKAKFTTPEGMTVTVAGTPKEIAAVLEDLKSKAAAAEGARRRGRPKAGPVLLVDLIASLKDGGFFKTPRDLASVKSALAELGHTYPITSLSPVMLRQVRRRNLRRVRKQGRWLYTS